MVKSRNKFYKNKSQWVLIIILTISFFSIHDYNINPIFESSGRSESQENEKNSLNTASENYNYEIIQTVLDQKNTNYQNLRYYPQVYQPSLQATYYALYILDSLNKLDMINTTILENYIISKYSVRNQYFIDKYAYRYLDSDYSTMKPWNSLLEVNCYAVLSLKILNRLEFIDTQYFKDFIWNCYNPFTSGFIGRPFDNQLMSHFKLSTLDNTYFAILTLNALMEDWSYQTPLVSELTSYINSLQSYGINGGFFNDDNFTIDSLDICEPNLISSFFGLKSLEMLGMTDSIRLADLHENLNYLHQTNNYFHISRYPSYNNESNIVASAIGLDLSIMTGFEAIDEQGVADFVINNRNEYGGWDSSTTLSYHELIDTFQILRSLQGSGYLMNLTTQERDEIADYIQLYEFNGLYSLMAEDYCSLTQLNSVINSFNYFGRIPDLPLQDIYDQLESVLMINQDTREFAACLNIHPEIYWFRSNPIEYMDSKYHHYSNNTDSMRSHEWNYLALDTLLKTYKLDDLGCILNLELFINETIESQFLDPTYENHGAFMQTPSHYAFSSKKQNDNIFFEYSYYAIKTMELLVDFLNLGNITDLAFNKIALSNYIHQRVTETDSFLYFTPGFTNNKEIILKYTYYMAYVLNSLGEKINNIQKVKNLINEYVDYHNIENIYFCYKIAETLDLQIKFDRERIQDLIAFLYDSKNHEFYVDAYHQSIKQETTSWICEMAKNSRLLIYTEFDSPVCLGSTCRMTVTFENLIVDQIESSGKVWFINEAFGTIPLLYQPENFYQTNIFIPFEPTYFPLIEGNIEIYDLGGLIGYTAVEVQTTIDHEISNRTNIEKDTITLEVNVSRLINGVPNPLVNSEVILEVIINQTIFEITPADKENFQEHSRYFLDYEFDPAIHHEFKVILLDDFYPKGLFILNKSYSPQIKPPIIILPPFKLNGLVLAVIGVGLSILAPGTVVLFNNNIKKRKEKKLKKLEKSKEQTQIPQPPSNTSILEEIKREYFRNT